MITHEVNYTYDALHRRIAKAVDTDGDGPMLPGVTHFVYDREDVILDFEDTDGAGPIAPVLAVRYLHGPGPDMIFAQENIGMSDVLWLLTDHLGTTRDLVDHAGALVNHIKYDSFGNVISQTDTNQSSRYLYTGRELETELVDASGGGLYYYRARFYDSTLGKFIQRDPMRFIDGSNYYEYVGSQPTQSIDPFGLRRRRLPPPPAVPIPDIGNGLPISQFTSEESIADFDRRLSKITGIFVDTYHVDLLWKAIFRLQNNPAVDLIVRRNVTNEIFQEALAKKNAMIFFLGHGDPNQGGNHGVSTANADNVPPLNFGVIPKTSTCRFFTCFAENIADATGPRTSGVPGTRNRTRSQVFLIFELAERLEELAKNQCENITVIILIGPRWPIPQE